ncbi:MAG: hypothetical protein WDO15_08565 [Bacteroidota bacterium]
MGPYVKKNFPEVDDVVRFAPSFSPRVIAYKDRIFEEKGFAGADPAIF